MKRSCYLAGVPFDTGTYDDIYKYTLSALKAHGLKKIYTPNPEILLVSFSDPNYQRILSRADLSLPDGNGLLWATTFLKKSESQSKIKILLQACTTYLSLVLHKRSLKSIIPQVLHGSNAFRQMHRAAQITHARIFYLGASSEVSNQIEAVMKKQYPGIVTVGTYHAWPVVPEDAKLAITEARPDMLFVALPFPKQERYIHENAGWLEEAGVKIAAGIGGTFDFEVGAIKRAPAFMQRLGIEWLWRLIMQPKRITRILRAVFVFPYLIIKKRLSGQKHLLILPPFHKSVNH